MVYENVGITGKATPNGVPAGDDVPLALSMAGSGTDTTTIAIGKLALNVLAYG